MSRTRPCWPSPIGSLFITDAERLGAETQKDLVRILDLREVQPIHFDGSVAVQTRLIAGTREDLAIAAQEGRFRLDLYERLAATVITVPRDAPKR